MPEQSVIVWDLETIPDLEAAARMLDMGHAPDAEVREAQFLTGFTTARGGLPIKIGEDVIGAAAVSGAPGGEKDEACVQTGLDKVQDQLK